MGNSYTKLVAHFTFSTYCRRPWLTEDIQSEVFGYMGGIIRGQRCASLIVNGVEDHVHILAHVRPELSVSDFMRAVKASSCNYLRRDLQRPNFAWQQGYAAFSVRGDNFERELRYIENQKEHHRKQKFEGELRRMLKASEVDFREEYLLG